MKFDELDGKMRVYETANDYSIVPEMYIIARIDGRNFTRLTKEIHKFESPYDIKFRDYMVATTDHLMKCGFKINYGYTESDEISLLLHKDENSFSRKPRKYNSILAGEASAKFSLLLGSLGVFDCRISQLPNKNLVKDYFRWRNEDASRNALNSHCYWMLRKKGEKPKNATVILNGMSVSDKNEILFQNGINFNDLPKWHKRGVGLYWESYDKEGLNPIDMNKVISKRKRIKIDYDLPMGNEYSNFIESII